MEKDPFEEPSTSVNHSNRRGNNHRYRSNRINFDYSIPRFPAPRTFPNPGRGRGFGSFAIRRELMHRQNIGNHHQRNYINKHRNMGFKTLEDLAKADSREILLKISEKRDAFMEFINSPIERPDVFSLVIEIVAKVCHSSFETLRLKFMIEICNTQFFVYLQNYLLNLSYETRKELNKLYWNNQTEFWNNFIIFCECITNVTPSTAIRSCRSLIDSTSKVCLENLRERHDFKLTNENEMKLNRIRENLTLYEQKEVKNTKKKYSLFEDQCDPPENFRDLSVIPTRDDLLERRPFLRPNIIDGAYQDTEHYLDVQFRLLREDCFGPLREGIDQYIKDPTRVKYDNIRVFRNVKFAEPYVSQLKSGYVVQLSYKTMKKFGKINWAHNKRFIYGSLVLFTKDDCKSFIVGTILDRDVNYLKQGKVPVALEDKTIGVNICLTEETYTMMESDVYFEPYFHVLNSLKDPAFMEHLAMSKYIVNVNPEINRPRYLTPNLTYFVNGDDDLLDINFIVMENENWPTYEQLGFNESQYEAYKFALTREFAVIQGPPGTGKTFLGVKVATTLLQNLNSFPNRCRPLLVICYTNHALDQFLEAILPITTSVARIGGQSRSEVMEQYNIATLRCSHCTRNGRHNYFYTERDSLKTLKNILQVAQERVHSLHYEVLSYDSIRSCIEEVEVLKKFYGNGDPLENWLFGTACTNAHLPNTDTEEEEEMFEINEDDHLHKRNDFSFDDLENASEHDEMFEVNMPKILNNISTTFSLKAAIEELKTLQATYPQIKNEQKLGEMYIKMNNINSYINLFKKMSTFRRQTRPSADFHIKDPTQIPIEQRWIIYFTWANIFIAKTMASIIPLQEKFVKVATAYEESRMIIDQEILHGIDVIGMTTTGAARLRKLLQSLAPPIVIVEEAAEVLEQHIITSLTNSCQHLILIGDHQQLRPSASHMKLAKNYNIEVSLFERMIMNEVHSRRLEVQHRMRPEIAALISPHIYSNLLNHSSVKNFPDVRGIVKNVFFLTHNYMEEVNDESSSKTNPQEGDLVLGLANYLVQQDYAAEDITILSAYSGQMFYMKKHRSLYSHLANVKITVVDNYQGEESKIILLSLVRNNHQNKIGFLGTENRICVALSRAKQGFYIFGNMELLRKNSELWEKIATTLEKSDSLGMSLKLRCEHHMENITKISELGDFAKVPEGGCMSKCGFNLSCGHQCPKICHGYDRGHTATKCIEKCARVLCSNGHICPLMCFTDCEPCKVMMNKTLPCGHEMPVPCHLEPKHPSVKCLTTINITLPACGHEIKKLCYLDMKYVVCLVPCVYRVDKCGHQCLRTCHVDNDPLHEKYNCIKPCAKLKQGCTAGLEGDTGNHQCNKKCHEVCDPCIVEVDKKRSNCKHLQRVPCNEDVNKSVCKNKCARSLPCGHFCKKKCFQDCGDCQQMVKKVIPDCKHQIKIECMLEPTRKLCTRSCQRVLPCGHPCPGLCKDECDPMNCTIKTQYKYDSPCGHKVQLPCNIFQLGKNESITEDVYLKHCDEPCMDLLACGHLCQGTCSLCFQGRLHIPCRQSCHQMNICGHVCQEPCNQVCPPCSLRCEVKCPHSQCNKLCGEICSPCQEGCMRKCAHGSCKRRCGQPCDRAACSARCPLVLPCGHPCRGLCGEPCPRICNICDPDNFPKGFIGEEYDDDAIFIQLQDCPHIMECEEMDSLMNADQESIAIRTCPYCRKPIINTNRYADLVRKTIVTEINPIKEKVYGSKDKIKLRKLELKQKLKDFKDKHHIIHSDVQYWRHTFNKLLSVSNKNKKPSLLSFEMLFVNLEILEIISDIYKSYRVTETSELSDNLMERISMICRYLYTNNIQKVSEQQQKDIRNELKRLKLIVQLIEIMNHKDYNDEYTQNQDVQRMVVTAKELLLSWKIFDEESAFQSLQTLQKQIKLSDITIKRERAMIIKAIGLKAGHWYKCQNGHFYCIGECGGAMEIGRCECGAEIGGQNHALLASNRHASEMDGSKYAAWSQEYNNMGNFLLE